ncbi:SRPBCC family protein [Marinobacter sp. CA1]|uniref:SRPBCC family protein n=1 Tax=Marinobacter sp. CA1 TaxID=2817656 RepID=UPI001D08F93F|nr:SRPBCC family protein [Marinobacter sp. CA1]UDL04964.1 SRPBCC family protein [Marinobacter sp. CA1]
MTQPYGELSNPDTLTIERLLPGPVERVWQYLTDPELRRQWLAAGPMTLEPDGEVELRFHNSQLSGAEDTPPAKYAQYDDEHIQRGTILACEPHRLLRFTWPMGDEMTEVSFELSPQGEKVKLVIRHSRLHQGDHLLSVASGWHTHLAFLLARLEQQQPPAFWATIAETEAEYARRFGLKRNSA